MSPPPPPSSPTSNELAAAVNRIGRPATRAWTHLIDAARKDEQESQRLRAEAERYLSAADAMAQKRRLARPISGSRDSQASVGGKQSIKDERIPTEAAEKADANARSRLDRGIDDKDPVNEIQPSLNNDQLNADTVQGSVDTTALDGADDKIVNNHPWNMYEPGSDKYTNAIYDALQMKIPWEIRTAALKDIVRVTASMSQPEAAALCEHVAASLASQFLDLRSMIVVAASDTVVACAHLFKNPETILSIFTTTLKVVIKTKAVMSNAGSTAAKALLKVHNTSGNLWNSVTETLEKSSHVKARLFAAECIRDVFVENEFHEFSDMICNAITLAVRDKAEEVRSAGKDALTRFGEKHGEAKRNDLWLMLPTDVQNRLSVANQIDPVKSVDSREQLRHQRRNMSGTGQSVPGPASKRIIPQKNVQKTEKLSVRDMIRMRREAMKDARAPDDNSSVGASGDTAQQNLNRHELPFEKQAASSGTTNDAERTDNDAVDESKKRTEIALSPQKTLSKRRVIACSEKENVPAVSDLE